MNWPGICVALATASAPTFSVRAQEGDAARGAELFPIRCIECHAVRVSDRQEDRPEPFGIDRPHVRQPGRLRVFRCHEGCGHCVVARNAHDLPRCTAKGRPGHQDELQRPEASGRGRGHRGISPPDRTMAPTEGSSLTNCAGDDSGRLIRRRPLAGTANFSRCAQQVLARQPGLAAKPVKKPQQLGPQGAMCVHGQDIGHRCHKALIRGIRQHDTPPRQITLHQRQPADQKTYILAHRLQRQPGVAVMHAAQQGAEGYRNTAAALWRRWSSYHRRSRFEI